MNHNESDNTENKIEELFDGNNIVAIKKRHIASKKLIVMLNGAINRNISQPPVFQRKTWLEYMPYNVLIIPDKTVEINDSLELGWYLGKSSCDYIHSIAKLVTDTANELNIDNESISFYGSSGGGYAAMILSTLLIGSNSISINPQTILRNYIKRIYDKFIVDTGHDENSPLLAVTSYMDERKYIPRMTLIQNRKDHLHYNEHFIPFMRWYLSKSSELSTFGDFSVTEFTSDKGHNAIPNVYESMPYMDKEKSNSYLVAQKKISDTPTITLYTKKNRLSFKMSGNNDKALIFVKGSVSVQTAEMLLKKGWMNSPKIGLCKYAIKDNPADDTLQISLDYLSCVDIGILHWQSQSIIQYKVLSQ